MDLLSKRYASPCFFLDGMIQTGRFDEFVDYFMATDKQEKEEKVTWDFFLHKVWEGTFDDFKAGVKNNSDHQNMSEQTIETTLKHTNNILNTFNPRE